MKNKFKKEKIATYTKYTNAMLEEITIGQDRVDFERELMTMQLSNFIFTSMIGEKTIIKTFDPPTLSEWLFNKERTVRIDVVAKEIMENPPDTDIIYNIEEHEEGK